MEKEFNCQTIYKKQCNMALPKKKKNINVAYDLNPPKIGKNYMEYGMDRIEELMNATDERTKYLPRTINFDDLDNAMFKYVKNDINLSLDGTKTPVFYMENERWGELQKTWKFYDGDKNVPTPYLLVRRIDKDKGTRIGDKSRIPQGRKFAYIDVPILDEGEVIYLRFKMPQPINVDLVYETTLLTKYREDVNRLDEIILKRFASIQDYCSIKGTPLPILLEGMEEANLIQNIDGQKLYVAKYSLKLLGLIRDEKEFEIVKTTRRPRIGYSAI